VNREGKVLLCLGAALLALEGVVRLGETTLSADLRQLRSHAAISGAIAAAHGEGRQAFLVVGNSLARTSLVADGLGKLGGGKKTPAVFYLTSDASDVSDWTAAYRRHLTGRPEASQPDQVFIVTGKGHLEDQPVVSPERLGAYHVAPADRAHVLAHWLRGSGDRARFLLACGSRLFANRDRIAPLVFYRCIPGYEAAARRLNENPRRGGDAPATARQVGAGRFGELLDAVGLPRERVCLVAAPLPWIYEIPPVIKAVAGNRGVILRDAAASESWPIEAFSDGYHLSGAVAASFTRDLVEGLGDSRAGPIRGEGSSVTPRVP
jgi:hypothetical protein